MIIRKCDRCGETIGTLETYAAVAWNVFRWGEHDSPTLTFDLCSRCHADFLEFLSTKPVEENKDHE